MGLTASAFLAAILDGLPGNHDDSGQDVMKTLLESLLPSETEWGSHRLELANQVSEGRECEGLVVEQWAHTHMYLGGSRFNTKLMQ